MSLDLMTYVTSWDSWFSLILDNNNQQPRLTMEFKVLNAPLFTTETATKLETHLAILPGIQHFTMDPENRQFTIVFDEAELAVDTLVQTLNTVGCPLQSINALTFR